MSESAASKRKKTQRAQARERRRELARFAWAAEMCSSCAYRPGTDASREEGDPGLTAARVALLAASQPFYCHDEPPPGAGEGRKLCVGHAARLTQQYRSGYVPTPEQHAAAVAAVQHLKCQRAISDAVDGLLEREAAADSGAPHASPESEG